MTHILWQMTTHLVCTEGHIIHAQWTLPEAEVQVDETYNGLKMTITARTHQITYDGAIRAEGGLICLECGAGVPEPLTKVPYSQEETSISPEAV